MRARSFAVAERCCEAGGLRMSLVQPLSRLQHTVEDCHDARSEARAPDSGKFLRCVTGDFR
jgi:hypothetical protein